MNKKLIAFALVCTLLTLISTAGIANGIMPCADLYFDSASAFLAANKLVVFDCTLYDVYDCISVTRVWLERKISGEWVYAKELTLPSYVAYNMADYVAEISYSSDIGSGTFRIGFTVDADGYAISRYSNSRTFP